MDRRSGAAEFYDSDSQNRSARAPSGIQVGAVAHASSRMPLQPASTAHPNQPVESKQSQTPQAQPAPVPVLTGTALAPKTRPAQPASTREATSESETVVENGFYRITFTNRGAQVKSWVLK